MSNYLITGVAGFIGSSIAQRLLQEGHAVTGIDCFTPYYDRTLKDRNVQPLRDFAKFHMIEDDLNTVDVDSLLADHDIIFHQAAQAGVLASWGDLFQTYIDSNIRATQRLLEATKRHAIKRFVYASSSSVYGNTADLPARETGIPSPISPYGVTKLAAEHLCTLYATNFGIPTVSLRYFTVYGPKQRPDMAMHKFIKATLLGTPLTVYGDGAQSRDFTYISDIVEANIRAAHEEVPAGMVINIGGGSRITVNDFIKIIELHADKKALISYIGKQAGDVEHTGADLNRSKHFLHFVPEVDISQGLAEEVKWIDQGLREGWLK